MGKRGGYLKGQACERPTAGCGGVGVGGGVGGGVTGWGPNGQRNVHRDQRHQHQPWRRRRLHQHLRQLRAGDRPRHDGDRRRVLHRRHCDRHRTRADSAGFGSLAYAGGLGSEAFANGILNLAVAGLGFEGPLGVGTNVVNADLATRTALALCVGDLPRELTHLKKI